MPTKEVDVFYTFWRAPRDFNEIAAQAEGVYFALSMYSYNESFQHKEKC